jgi:hypothetical protein
MVLEYLQSRKMKWAGHVACMGYIGNTYNISVGKAKGKRLVGRLGIDSKIILEWISGK